MPSLQHFIKLVEMAYSECDGNWRSCVVPETIYDVIAHINECDADGVLRYNAWYDAEGGTPADGDDGARPELDYKPVLADWTASQLAQVLAAAQAIARSYDDDGDDEDVSDAISDDDNCNDNPGAVAA